ncbi:MAG: Dabb family protein [Verrucomicrobiales bacterium]
MVRHSVYFWLIDGLTAEQKSDFEKGMEALFEIDVVKKGNWGTAAATPERPVTDNGYDYTLILEFDEVDGHNAYQVHDDHTVFVDSFRQWFDTVKIFDATIN